jgi:hypothetical protein
VGDLRLVVLLHPVAEILLPFLLDPAHRLVRTRAGTTTRDLTHLALRSPVPAGAEGPPPAALRRCGFLHVALALGVLAEIPLVRTPGFLPVPGWERSLTTGVELAHAVERTPQRTASPT